MIKLNYYSYVKMNGSALTIYGKLLESKTDVCSDDFSDILSNIDSHCSNRNYSKKPEYKAKCVNTSNTTGVSKYARVGSKILDYQVSLVVSVSGSNKHGTQNWTYEYKSESFYMLCCDKYDVKKINNLENNVEKRMASEIPLVDFSCCCISEIVIDAHNVCLPQRGNKFIKVPRTAVVRVIGDSRRIKIVYGN